MKLETAGSVLAVFAHPDDESLVAGGVLAARAAAGARTAVVTATWAEGTHRAEELTEAVGILVAGKPRLLGYADAKVPESAPGAVRWCDVPLDEAVGRLVAQIREFRPEVLLTHDAYGGLSGHPDHRQTHRVTLLAARAAGLGLLYPEAGPAWQPAALYGATHPASVARELGRRLAPGRVLYAMPDEQVTTAVDVRPWVRTKLCAIFAHRSEVERGALPGRLAAVSVAEREQLTGTEWYVRHEV
ncbi:PIG-L deacetylase family protein [Kitasatospora sp. NPDC096147]|uniref:PIG-L deacetylase family protein n=1 Tax=Kitasatospora sp. NPDC096147 TaxID=3364093 RepID=UPI00381B9954